MSGKRLGVDGPADAVEGLCEVYQRMAMLGFTYTMVAGEADKPMRAIVFAVSPIPPTRLPPPALFHGRSVPVRPQAASVARHHARADRP